jgi:hypothetical protein
MSVPPPLRPSRRSLLAAGLLGWLQTVVGAGPATAAPAAAPWPRWAIHDNASAARVDHGPWTAFLARHVKPDGHGINRVAYGQVSPAERRQLAAYVTQLEQVDVDHLRQDEQRAFWINLYNALTVATVIDHYPVTSIRDIAISPGWFSRGPWGAKLVRVAGEALSLDDIEHRILRPLWRDPRLHYALNCAALGCPNLAARAYEADTAEAMLEEAARAYVNHPRGARIDRGRLFVSSIYVWFADDFGASDTAIVNHIKHYAGPDLLGRLAMIDQISGDDYNWDLNDEATAHAG